MKLQQYTFTKLAAALKYLDLVAAAANKRDATVAQTSRDRELPGSDLPTKSNTAR